MNDQKVKATLGWLFCSVVAGGGIEPPTRGFSTNAVVNYSIKSI